MPLAWLFLRRCTGALLSLCPTSASAQSSLCGTLIFPHSVLVPVRSYSVLLFPVPVPVSQSTGLITSRHCVRDGTARSFTTEKCREHLLQCLLDVSLQQNLRGIIESGKLPTRFLPPGKRADLYHLYVASRAAAGQRVASVQTFYRSFESSGWSKRLQFRSKSQHTMCSICHKLRSRIAHCHNFAEHARLCDKYHRHLAGMYADRRCYAAQRAREPRLQNHNHFEIVCKCRLLGW